MSAQVDILIIDIPDVLSVPVQAVLQYKGKDHLDVKTATGGYKEREVTLGMSNDKLVEVKKGLASGDSVALSPVLLMSEDRSAKPSAPRRTPARRLGRRQDEGRNRAGRGGRAGAAGADAGKAKKKAGGGMARALAARCGDRSRDGRRPR